MLTKLNLRVATSALCAVLVCQPAASALAQNQAVLARDHPDAAVFLQMARRGIVDYTARQGSSPPNLQAVQDNGYSAYLFPTNWHPLYEVRNGIVHVGTYGRPVYFAGQFVKTYDIRVFPLQPGLYHDASYDIPDTSAGRVRHLPGVQRVWHFPGAEWLAVGHTWNEVDQALRADRVATHLNWLTYEYNRAFNAMPGGLRDLEAFLGTSRNPLCWKGLTEVTSPAIVSWQPGNIFVGWDRGAWVVSVNEGLMVDTHRWVPGTQGYYTCHSSLVY